MLPESFHFLRPLWLLAIPAMLPVLWLALRSRAASSAWQRVCDPELLAALLSRGEVAASRWPGVLLALAGSVACVAAAGPTWERLPQPAYESPSSSVIVVNLSPSMDATDVAPSRLGRARFEVTDALAGLADEHLALVIFSEEPFTVTPLADDPAVIGAQVPVLETSLMPGNGTRVDRAIDHAAELLSRAAAVNGRILLISDSAGDDPQAAVDAAARAAAAGVRVSVLGVGTEEGAPVPVRRGFLRDTLGNPITARLERAALEKVARAGHGHFALATADDSDLHAVMPASEPLPGFGGELTPSGVRTDVWRDMGAALLAIPLLLAPFAFRKGWASALLLVALAGGVTIPADAQAAGWEDWWSRPDQQGAEAFAAGRPADAAKLFEDPARRAAALYRAEDYAAAAESLQDQEGTEARYNLGNALAREGQLEQALAAYDEALAAQPEHEDARFNRDLVAKLLEQQKQEQEQQQDQSQQQQQPQEQDPQQSGQSQNEQSQPQDSQDPQDPKNQQEPKDQQGQNGQQEEAAQPDAEKQEQQAQQQAEEQKAEAEPKQPEQAEQSEKGEPKDPQKAAPAEPQGPQSERELALEQWLNRIPDDPGGLLREKLRRQYAERRYGR